MDPIPIFKTFVLKQEILKELEEWDAAISYIGDSDDRKAARTRVLKFLNQPHIKSYLEQLICHLASLMHYKDEDGNDAYRFEAPNWRDDNQFIFNTIHDLWNEHKIEVGSQIEYIFFRYR